MLKGQFIFGNKYYDFFNFVAVIIFFVFNFANVNKKKLVLSNASSMAMNHLSQGKVKILGNVYFWSLLETAVISYIMYMLPYNKPFGDYFETGPNYFGLLFMMPCVLFVFFYIISVDPLKQMDLVTPALALALIATKIACFGAGCCRGIECSFGLYNKASELVEFPVQLLEAALALLLFVFLMFIGKKAKAGTLFPLYTILYGGTRFFSEFLRHEPAVFWNLKKYQILCLIGLAVGIVELLIAMIFGDKIAKIYTKYGAIELITKVYTELRFKYIKIKKKIMKRDGPIVHHKKHKKKNLKKVKNRK